MSTVGLAFVVGTDFFPSVDAGMIGTHLRAPAGTRLDDTEVVVAEVEQRIRAMMGPDFGTVTDTLGIPTSTSRVRAAASDLALREQLHDRAKLLAPNVMSLQDLQTATANLTISNSSMHSALALQGYETIRAPSDGVVTMRYVDPGAWMPAATGATSSAQPFVDVADPSRLRIWAYVGQDEALQVGRRAEA